MSGLVFSLKIWYTIDVEILQRNESCNLETSVFSVADPQKNHSVYTFAHACTGHGVGEKRYRYERNDYRCNGCSSCRSFRCNYLRTEKGTNDDECSCCDEPENEEDTENTAEAAGCCCADGVCSIDSEDDTTDQPAQVHMPTEESTETEPKQDDTGDSAEQTIPIHTAEESTDED